MRHATLRTLVLVLLAIVWNLSGAADTEVISLQSDSGHPGPTIARDIFGQFAEHLGSGIYDGIWVGRDSPIPNVRGIRSDVVAALRALKVPNVRWPGGCFADAYHWRDAIGPQATRKATVNTNWGGAYVPFQDATALPVHLNAGTYSFGALSLPRIDAMAARAHDGKLWPALVNLDPGHEVRISAHGEVLTAPHVDSINTYDQPQTVVPEPISGHMERGRVALTLPPKSVAVIGID